MTTTADNLATAFAGESQANRKYLAFARQAEKEGFPQIGRLFRAAAEAETIHALAHFNNMGGVGSTIDNLKAAVAGETYEYTQMYPPMLEQAIESGKDLEGAEIYLCPVCGNLEIGKPTAKCPICGALPEKYRRID